MNKSNLVLKSGSSLNNVLQKGVDCLSAVFSLNGAVAGPSRSESAGQAYLTVDTIENVIGGGGDCADGRGMARKQDELDGPINCKPLIDGLLIKEAVSQKQKKLVHFVEPETAPAPGLSALNRGARLNQLMLVADQGKVVSSCGTSTIQISISR